MLLSEMVWGKDYDPAQARQSSWPSLRWDALRAKALAGVTKAYNPNQTRAPVGSPEGGRWVAAGGSLAVSATSNTLTDRARGVVEMAFPDWATAGVDEVKVIEGAGKEFTAGGNNFREGAHWDSSVRTIRVFNQTDATFNSDAFEEMVSHEIGHSLFDEWWGAAHDEENSFYNAHSGLYDSGGNIKPEYKAEHDKATPFATARDKFTSAWRKGEDGITDYSKAWAKDGVFCETVAEMSKAYFTAHGKYLSSDERWKMAEENVRQIAAGSGAVHLGVAFNAAMRAFRKAGKKGVVSRKAPLVVATQPTFYKAKGKTIRKFFFSDGRESLPINADYAVELVIGDDGRVVSSTRYMVRRGV